MHLRRREGLRSFPGSLPKDYLIQREIRYRSSKPLVFRLAFFQPFKLIPAHPVILFAPPVIGLHGHTDLPHSLRCRLALTMQNFNLPQLPHNILGLLSLYRHPLVHLKTG